jgi:2-dehydropantoate 2-reductase
MRIAVVGAGAMGSVYAGLLAVGGNEVVVVDAWREHVEAINRDGLRVEGASGDRTVRMQAATDASELEPVELVVLATKAYDVEAAARSASPLLTADTLVLTIQNGLGSADRVAAILGEERVAVGIAGGFGASIRAPGHVHHNGWELVRMGERRGGSTPRIERVAETWRSAGFRAEACDDIQRAIWEKLTCNVAFSGPCVLLERPIGAVLSDPHAWEVASACAAEAYDVARASGVELGFTDAAEHVRTFGERIPEARPSTLLDYAAGRRSEIGVINGAIPTVAQTVGKEAPVNAAVTALVLAKEAARAAG